MGEPTAIGVPSGAFEASVEVPGDKSLSHRALVLSAMAEGVSTVTGLPDGADVRSTAAVLTGLGVDIGTDRVVSPGFSGWSAPSHPLDCGNSGTTMRLMAGALAATSFESVLTGDASLSRRPMRRLLDPLGALGARLELGTDGTAPIRVFGSRLQGAAVTIPIASAQVRTAVAFAGLNASGPTTIDSPSGFRDHTERWLAALGRAEIDGPSRLTVHPGPVPPLNVVVPRDPSSAAFLWAAAAVRPGSRVTTPGISLNPGRLGFLRLLVAMGVRVHIAETGDVLGDPVGDVTVESSTLHGITVTADGVAAAIDELPLLAVVAARASGETVVTGATELRFKESDRIAAAVALAAAAGGSASALDDGFVVEGGIGQSQDGIDSAGDHRVAMAAAVAAVASDRTIEIAGFDACAVSWPGFRAALERMWS